MFAPAKLRPRMMSLPFVLDCCSSSGSPCRRVCWSSFVRSRSVIAHLRKNLTIARQQLFHERATRWRAACSGSLGGAESDRIEDGGESSLVEAAVVDHRRGIFPLLSRGNGLRRLGHTSRRLVPWDDLGARDHHLDTRPRAAA